MNREIKFRYHWTKNGPQYAAPYMVLSIYWLDGPETEVLVRKSKHETEEFTLDGGVLCQFTGLYDKRGKEIYEGDIVRCSSSNRCPHEVIWTDIPNENLGSAPGWYLSDLMGGYSFTGMEEVIGNIYEHPELLKP
ncbi:MAG: hypothetical protein KDB88_01420 [Flavobacteriales bacterium]|nr:hypothetical protein [Flavobacteriales bacterium]